MPCRTYHRRRGTVLIYCTVSFVTLCGFVSLGVDLGRAQLAKTELQRAADAAARYAVQGASDGTYLTKAQAAAVANTVDGTSLNLLSGDVTVGTWSGTVFTAGGAKPNAVKIVAVRSAARGTAVPLLFAQVLGFTSCNVSAVSIAYKADAVIGTYAVAGTNSVSFVNGAKTDSYDSSAGAYSAGTAGSLGGIGSNGSISLNGATTKVKGDVNYGTTFSDTGATVTGALTQLSSTMTFPDATPPPAGSYTYYGTQNVTGGSMPMAGGVVLLRQPHHERRRVHDARPCDDLHQRPANDERRPNLSISESRAEPPNHQSFEQQHVIQQCVGADCRRLCSESATTFTGASAQLYGRIIAKSATIDGGAIHYDTSLPSVGAVNGAGAITTVK